MKPKVLTDLTSGIEYILPEDHRERTIGRDPKCYISLPYPTVSGYHATIIHEKGGQVYIWDSKSTNGTYVKRKSGEVIDVKDMTTKKMRTQLFNGDELTLGKRIELVLDTRDIEAEKKAEKRKRLQDTEIDIKVNPQ